jgi:3-deoxy-D-manno-octulosonic-acid transferase
MWSSLHDIFVAFGLGLHLVYRALRGIFRGDGSIREYAAYRAGLRINQLGELDPAASEHDRPLLWFHGVSVGEVAALDGMIAEIRGQTGGDVRIAVSTMTSEGLRAARRLANQPDLAFIYPLDLSFFAKRIVRRLRPKSLVIIDGDFWLQMLRACRAAHVPVVIVNGRLSEGSATRYSRFPSYARQLFSGVALASVQSETMAARFARFIPRSRIVIDGNLKLDLQPAPFSEDRRDALRRRLGIDPLRLCFVFGSIHPAELSEIAEPITRLLAHHGYVQVVIAPRHPDKFSPSVLDKYFPGVRSAWVDQDISDQEIFDKDGFDRKDADRDAAPRDESGVGGERQEPARLIWVNRLGVLRDLYQIAGAAFVGGTFCDVGGHNLAEPTLAGVPVFYGPLVHAQLPLHELLESYGASKQLATRDDLYPAMAALVDDPALREKMAWHASRLRADSEGLAARVAASVLEIAGIANTRMPKS